MSKSKGNFITLTDAID